MAALPANHPDEKARVVGRGPVVVRPSYDAPGLRAPGGVSPACREPHERFLAMAEPVMPDRSFLVARADLIRRLEPQRTLIAHHGEPHLRVGHGCLPAGERAALQLEAIPAHGVDTCPGVEAEQLPIATQLGGVSIGEAFRMLIRAPGRPGDAGRGENGDATPLRKMRDCRARHGGMVQLIDTARVALVSPSGGTFPQSRLSDAGRIVSPTSHSDRMLAARASDARSPTA